MKIQQLLQREPFGDIIEKTLARFLSHRFGRPYRVIWQRRKPFSTHRRRDTDRGATWYCNPYLNAVFPARADGSVLRAIREGYVHTPVAHRRVPQWLYVTAATHPATAPIFATYRLEIEPVLLNRGGMLIMGGNNRIYLVDLHQQRVWDILKFGFDAAPMRSELQVRRLPGEWPFPTLRSVAQDGTWFESDYVPAVSLNRLRRETDRDLYVGNALNILGRWLDQTCQAREVTAYVGCLVQEIHRVSWAGHLFTVEDRRLVERWAKLASGIVSTALEKKGLSIDLALGHGDFQDGNILVDASSQVWIVDWEHARQRQVAYDYLVFALRSRFPGGLAARIQAALENPALALCSLPAVHPHVRRLTADTRLWAITLTLFVLEDLLWNLQENANPVFRCQSGAWLALRAEVEPALWHIAAR